ncbi:hypothetical protein T10_1936 [Trichinella papuae]|uniref:Uncharacterized protein n=1 Tax=Trichinella papuae TaxID=268474 RepID=A0A0V1LXN8_9BILA|nr:hypothetical protein T10_1936 [Trichinella papuae]
MLRVRYKHGTPLEGGKIADSEPVDLYADARRIAGEKDDASKGEGEVVVCSSLHVFLEFCH